MFTWQDCWACGQLKAGKAWSETSREVTLGRIGTSLLLALVRIVLVQGKSGFSCAAHVTESSDKPIVNFFKEAYTGMHAVLSFVS